MQKHLPTVVSLKDALSLRMDWRTIEAIADWHDEKAERAAIEEGQRRAERHEMVSFRLRKLAHEMRSVHRRSLLAA